MKRASYIFGFSIFVLAFCFQVANACTITEITLRKQFRKAKNVFVAEVIDIKDVSKNLPQAKEKMMFGAVKFKIEKSWKGLKAGEITLFSNVGSSVCGSDFDYFRKGEQYLVFAEKDYVYFNSATKLALAADKIKRLDNFWFRAWARIYAF